MGSEGFAHDALVRLLSLDQPPESDLRASQAQEQRGSMNERVGARKSVSGDLVIRALLGLESRVRERPGGRSVPVRVIGERDPRNEPRDPHEDEKTFHAPRSPPKLNAEIHIARWFRRRPTAFLPRWGASPGSGLR